MYRKSEEMSPTGDIGKSRQAGPKSNNGVTGPEA